jgi:hypothetical protein
MHEGPGFDPQHHKKINKNFLKEVVSKRVPKKQKNTRVLWKARSQSCIPSTSNRGCILEVFVAWMMVTGKIREISW